MPLMNLDYDVVQKLMYTSIKICYNSNNIKMAYFLIGFFSDRIRPIEVYSAISPALDFLLSVCMPDEYSTFIFRSSGETLHNIITTWLYMSESTNNDLIARRLGIIIAEVYPSLRSEKDTLYDYGIVHGRLLSINNDVSGWINSKALDFVRKGYMRNSDYAPIPSWIKQRY